MKATVACAHARPLLVALNLAPDGTLDLDLDQPLELELRGNSLTQSLKLRIQSS